MATEKELRQELAEWKAIAKTQVKLIGEIEMKADKLYRRVLELEAWQRNTQLHYDSAAAYKTLLAELERHQAHIRRLQGI